MTTFPSSVWNEIRFDLQKADLELVEIGKSDEPDGDTR